MNEIINEFINNKVLPNADEKVTVKQVWENRYRINLWSFEPVTKVRKSYFVKINDKEITYCNPAC